MSRFRPLSRSDLVAIAGAIIVAGGCVWLGMWQLDRLAQRRARNAKMEEASRTAAVAVGSLSAQPKRLTRVVLEGLPDYRHEFALAGRTRNGSPGVNIITPFRLAGRDTAILVNRGWVYSPDASEVDFARWRERDSMTVAGFVDTLLSGQQAAGAPVRQFRRLEYRQVAARMPYPIAPYYIVAQVEGTSPGVDTPVRIPAPALDEGPHKSYAFQWFSFAAIALLGTSAYLLSTRRGLR